MQVRRSGVEPALEGGPDERGEALADAGVVRENHAVVQGGARVILALEFLECEAEAQT